MTIQKKSNPDRLAGLTEEENTEYQTTRWVYVKKILESLAAARASDERKLALLKKYQWVVYDAKNKIFYCLECKRRTSPETLKLYKGRSVDLHLSNCALAAELKEGG